MTYDTTGWSEYSKDEQSYVIKCLNNIVLISAFQVAIKLKLRRNHPLLIIVLVMATIIATMYVPILTVKEWFNFPFYEDEDMKIETSEATRVHIARLLI